MAEGKKPVAEAAEALHRAIMEMQEGERVGLSIACERANGRYLALLLQDLEVLARVAKR